MYARRRSKLTGLLYLSPALLFVTAFTAYPFVQMVWLSFNNWTLISPPRFIGTNNFTRAAGDDQFWVSLGYTLEYTLLITPILMVGGYALALLVSPNTPLRRFTRAVIFIPVVIGLGVSSLLWVWLFDPSVGLINKALSDLGLIDKPIQWLGTDAWVSTWSIILSVVWKVLGFGMILFVAAIHAIPHEINEATMVDGASFWQRTRRVTVPLTRPTILLVTLISVIGSLLAFDQFYIMTAGQPFNQTATAVFYVYLNSFPYLKLGYGAALSLILAADHPGVHDRPDDPDPPEPGVTAVPMRAPLSRAWTRVWAGRNRYLVGALCLFIVALMVAPIVLSMMASVKSTAEAAAVPPTYVPHSLSLDSYERLWTYQAGLPAYLFNSFATAFMTIAFALALTIPAGYALARFPIPGKELLFVYLLFALIIPYQALLTPLFLMFAAAEADQHADRAGHRPHRDPAPVQPVHHAQQLRGGAPRARGGRRHRRRRTPGRSWSGSSSRRSCRRSSPWPCSRSSRPGTNSSAPWS